MRLLQICGSLLAASVSLVGQTSTISTVAGTSGRPENVLGSTISLPDQISGVATDSAGNLFIALQTDNVVLRYDAQTGMLTRIAGNWTSGFSGDGGLATSAQLKGPSGVAIDQSGNIYIADDGNSRIRKVSLDGKITTVAGNGTNGGSGSGVVDGGQATSAQIRAFAVAVDNVGNLYIAELGRIRKVDTSGIISTIAGNGTLGNTGDGGLPMRITQQAGTPLAITTPSLLLGSTGLDYSQILGASGGVQPYNWSVVTGSGALPGGLSLASNGMITGTPTAIGTFTFTVQVKDASMATATQKYSLTVVSTAGPVHTGALAHIAAGGAQWTTVITIVNTSSSPVAVSLVLHQDDGSIPSAMPVTTTQQGITQTVTGGSVNAVLGPNSSLLISAGDPSQPEVVGWADVLSSGPVGGFAIFRSALGTPSEGTVPLQTQTAPAIFLPYDNTAGFKMGVALANTLTSSATITATMWDDSGTLLGSQGFPVAGSGHTSFELADQLPLTAGKRGVVRFQTSGTGGLTGLGLRFSPFGTFTSVPTMIP